MRLFWYYVTELELWQLNIKQGKVTYGEENVFYGK